MQRQIIVDFVSDTQAGSVYISIYLPIAVSSFVVQHTTVSQWLVCVCVVNVFHCFSLHLLVSRESINAAVLHACIRLYCLPSLIIFNPFCWLVSSMMYYRLCSYDGSLVHRLSVALTPSKSSLTNAVKIHWLYNKSFCSIGLPRHLPIFGLLQFMLTCLILVCPCYRSSPNSVIIQYNIMIILLSNTNSWLRYHQSLINIQGVSTHACCTLLLPSIKSKIMLAISYINNLTLSHLYSINIYPE